MIRLGLVVVLLQGSLFTALASTPHPEEGNNHTQEVTEPPLYQFGNKDDEPCILMEMDAYVSIKWEVGSNESKEIDMFLEPSKVITTGSCTEDEANLSLTWKSFHLRWNFAKTRDWAKWFAKQVELQYDKSGLDNKIVNGTTGMSTVSTRGSSEVMLFSAPIGEAYNCPSGYEIELSGAGGDSANLRLRNFRVQPFLAKSTFGASYCPTHTTGAAVMSTTDSSGSSDPHVIKPDISSPMGTSVHTNVASATPIKYTYAPVPSSAANASHDSKYSAVTSPSGTSSRPPAVSATPSSVSGRTAVPSGSSRAPAHEDLGPTPTRRPTTAFQPSTPGAPVGTSLPPYAYQKAFPNIIKMPFYPPKKVFFSGVKMDENETLSAMLWSWYTSGFYTGYYQAQQQVKKMH